MGTPDHEGDNEQALRTASFSSHAQGWSCHPHGEHVSPLLGVLGTTQGEGRTPIRPVHGRPMKSAAHSLIGLFMGIGGAESAVVTVPAGRQVL